MEALQYGVGSHSTANNTIFRGNIIGNVNYGINIRSQNVEVSHNQFFGNFRSANILLAYGKNVIIKENKTITNINKPELFAKDYKLPSKIDNATVSAFLHITQTYNFDEGSIIIKNNQVKNISHDFIKFIKGKNADKKVVNHLEIEDNAIEYLKGNKLKQYFINSYFPLSGNKTKITGNKINKNSNYKPYNNFTIIKE